MLKIKSEKDFFAGMLFLLVGAMFALGATKYSMGRASQMGPGYFPLLLSTLLALFGALIVIRSLRLARRELDLKGMLPTWADVKHAAPAMMRGTAIGSILGVLPGGGALLASFASYSVDKKIRLKPGEEPFGEGNIRGVASPEAANNAGAQTSFIPLLTLGLPSNGVMALMIGAMTLHSIQPGPQVMTSNPQLFWGVVASMWVGNLMLVILNLPLIGIWVKFLSIPYRFLFPAIVLFCAIGVYTTNNSSFDIWLIGIFGIVGYVFILLECEPAPLILGFILGPMMEEYLRRALLLSHGNWTVLITSPLSATLLAMAALLMVVTAMPAIKQQRKVVFTED